MFVPETRQVGQIVATCDPKVFLSLDGCNQQALAIIGPSQFQRTEHLIQRRFERDSRSRRRDGRVKGNLNPVTLRRPPQTIRQFLFRWRIEGPQIHHN